MSLGNWLWGHCISHTSVGAVLRACGYSLQANRKTREGSHHPDRNAQFEHINQTVSAALAEGQPAISVDAKKKELVGDFKNAGWTWRPQGHPEAVRVVFSAAEWDGELVLPASYRANAVGDRIVAG